MHITALLLVAGFAASAAAAPAHISQVVSGRPALESPSIGAHHAVYTLSLQSTQDQGVLAASGSMTYDVTDACTGWTTAQHLVIDYTDRDAHDVTMISDYATFETKDGTRLEFHTRQSSGGELTEQLDGTATLDHSGGKGHADFTVPERKRVLLPAGTLLPTAHTLAILQEISGNPVIRWHRREWRAGYFRHHRGAPAAAHGAVVDALGVTLHPCACRVFRSQPDRGNAELRSGHTLLR
jgi:hypothetical protein